MNIGGSMQFEFGQLKCVSAVHSSSLPDGSYGGCAMGFVLTVDDKRIYYAGDTALTLDMKLIGEYWRPDIALLPIGNHFTMDATDAIIAASFVQCKEIIGMHYDTFGFIKIDHALTQQLFNEAGLSLTLMQIGESKTI
jgi:L-ascorbate metabolism protein UlaG (beta-lactamase superfamily)